MKKVQHGFTVGMFALNGVAAGTGSSSASQLRDQIRRAYEGEPDIRYEACNHIHCWTDSNMWGHGAPEPGAQGDRVANNINGWTTFMEQVKAVADEFDLPPGGIKANISRLLAGLHQGAEDGSWPPWDLETEIKPYVQGLCYEIKSKGLEEYVAGWFFADETYTVVKTDPASKKNYTSSDFHDLAAAVHWAQKNPEEYDGAGTETACDFPFCWQEPINTSRVPGESNLEYLERGFWDINIQNQRVFETPDDFKEWLDVFLESDLQDASLIFRPFYYPWGAPREQLRYRKHATNAQGVLSEELPDNPPWRLWNIFLAMDDPYTGATDHSLRGKFPNNTTYPKSKLRFEPVMNLSKEAHQDNESIFPRHVDAHMMCRVMMNMMRHWEDDLSDDRLTGFWFIGWNQTGANPTTDGVWSQWMEADSYKFAEAIQNEIGEGGEGIADAYKDESGNVIQTEIVDIKFQPKGTGAPEGRRIDVHIAPTSLMREEGDPDALVMQQQGSAPKMGKRSRAIVLIEMRTQVNPEEWTLVRDITVGYGYPDSASERRWPHGRYDQPLTEQFDPGVDQPHARLGATAIYWDGRWDRDDPNTEPDNEDGVVAEPGTYRARLVLDGVVADVQTFTIA